MAICYMEVRQVGKHGGETGGYMLYGGETDGFMLHGGDTGW